MYEYEFETITFGLLGKPDRDYHEVIRSRASQGWRLAHIRENAIASTLEFFFERPARGPQDVLRADGPDELPPPQYQTLPELNRG